MRRLFLAALLAATAVHSSRARQVVDVRADTTVAPPSIAASPEVTSDSLAMAAADSAGARFPTPRGALWRGALVPGWGHVYTRRFGRLPFVYGALGGLTFVAFRVHGQYSSYREAFRYKAYQELVERGDIEENPWAELEASYDDLAAEIGPVPASVLRSRRDNLRRNRDLSILATGVIWALSVLDAYVGAHMLDFDVSEDLSVRVVPTVGAGWPVASLAWRSGNRGTGIAGSHTR